MCGEANIGSEPLFANNNSNNNNNNSSSKQTTTTYAHTHTHTHTHNVNMIQHHISTFPLSAVYLGTVLCLDEYIPSLSIHPKKRGKPTPV
jgi:hypothetical protein